MASALVGRYSPASCTVALALLWVLHSATGGDAAIARQNQTWPRRILPGMRQFPSSEAFFKFTGKLEGVHVDGLSPHYANASRVYNMRKMAFPIVNIFPATVSDIQKTLTFAYTHNLWVTIRSSGKSPTGRSAHHGSVTINLYNMKGISFNLTASVRSPAGEVTVQSGNTWIEVYRKVDQQVTRDADGNVQRRLVVGYIDKNVAVGGFSQGGGSSPIGRLHGLVVDNMLQATLVLANGTKAVVSERGTTLTDLEGHKTFTDDTSLFWAIRGGGGGTWGVVADFTFRLHFAPQRVRNVRISWALRYQIHDIGSATTEFVIRQLEQLSNQWGGFMTVMGHRLDNNTVGLINLYLNHLGNDSDASNNEVNALLNHNTYAHQFEKKDNQFDTFLQYEESVPESPGGYYYTFANVIPTDIVDNPKPLGDLTKFLMDLTNGPSDTSYSNCYGTLVGGKMSEVPREATPVNPRLRFGLMSLMCSLSWTDVRTRDSFYVQHALKMRNRLARIGDGADFDEAAEDLDDWKMQFWGDRSTYDSLLAAKGRWDPGHFFWCHNCVGSDVIATPDDVSSHCDDKGHGHDDDHDHDDHQHHECTTASRSAPAVASLSLASVVVALAMALMSPA